MHITSDVILMHFRFQTWGSFVSHDYVFERKNIPLIIWVLKNKLHFDNQRTKNYVLTEFKRPFYDRKIP